MKENGKNGHGSQPFGGRIDADMVWDSAGGRSIARVVSGSLEKGLEARLEPGISVEDMAVGRYVIIDGKQGRYFAMITDVKLGSTDPKLAISPPDLSDPFLAEVFDGISTYGIVTLSPMLKIANEEEAQARAASNPKATPEENRVLPVKTIPSYYSLAHEATEGDLAIVFGGDDKNHFYIGQPIEMKTKVCLNISRFVERSSGVFGKSGTGKTMLTRILLAGIIQKNAAVNLVFDMHSEYGWSGRFEGNSTGTLKGLQQLYPNRVVVFTLDPDSARKRRERADFVVEIGYNQIEAEDFELIRDALDMHPAQIECIPQLITRFGEGKWIGQLVAMDAEGIAVEAKSLGLNSNSLTVLRRKLITRILKLPFIKPEVNDDSVKRIIDCLRSGTHVILDFGTHSSLEAYILVANILTRRIHDAWVDMSLRSMAEGQEGNRPKALVITIEEAHKFLAPDVANLTIFGKIAREMRKHQVTLLVVDQRPSGISDEVMSQIGTRVACLLDDDKDVAAVLSGIPNAQAMKAVLAKLETKQQAIILGHAVPTPIAIRTRDYGTAESYQELTSAIIEGTPVRGVTVLANGAGEGSEENGGPKKADNNDLSSLFGDDD